MQKIRNRISAQESRDRRKVYIDSLETENRILIENNQLLKDKIEKLESEKLSLVLKSENAASTKAGESLDNITVTDDDNCLQSPESCDDEHITRSRINSSSGLDWKVGTLFVIALLCFSAILPSDFSSNNIAQVKTNSMVPLLNPNFSTKSLLDNTAPANQ